MLKGVCVRLAVISWVAISPLLASSLAVNAAETPVSGTSSSAAASQAGVLTLARYLDQVKAQNPDAHAALLNIEAAESAANEAGHPFAAEFYSQLSLYDNLTPPTSPIMPAETRGASLKFGVREQTTFGLNYDAYLNTQRTQLLGFSPVLNQFFSAGSSGGTTDPSYYDYEQSAIGINLKQSLWRDGFGEASRARLEAGRAMSRHAILAHKFELKNILLRAENAYWSLVSYNEIIKLQGDNVERARRLRDHMRQRASLRLYDDVDALQADAALGQRELELQSSTNDRETLLRQFNTLRGEDKETAEALVDLPADEFMLKQSNDPSKHMAREDFKLMLEQARAAAENSRAAESGIKPSLDLVGGISTNGLDNYTWPSVREAAEGKHPNWSIGLVFAMPLDFRLLSDLRSSYRAQARASQAMAETAKFNEARVWDDLLKQNREAQAVYQKSLGLEKLMTELVKKERQRMLNGRSTTLQTTTIEQNLASAQIVRIRAQLGLLQIHNLIKQFFAEQP